nr:hypothetical protein HeiferVagina-S102_00058 [Bovine alphaherpesvirus 1]WHT50262.1 hypothetical protein Milk-S104_00058 [Bovine alphaherpesvirus 1]WHT50352.1 hypothetical protein Docile-S101_00060 [Bovine alphaherpesvirus 1]
MAATGEKARASATTQSKPTGTSARTTVGAAPPPVRTRYSRWANTSARRPARLRGGWAMSAKLR